MSLSPAESWLIPSRTCCMNWISVMTHMTGTSQPRTASPVTMNDSVYRAITNLDVRMQRSQQPI